MEIEEFRDRKRLLEMELTTLISGKIRTFAEDTGFAPLSIDVIVTPALSYIIGEQRGSFVVTDVELKFDLLS